MSDDAIRLVVGAQFMASLIITAAFIALCVWLCSGWRGLGMGMAAWVAHPGRRIGAAALAAATNRMLPDAAAAPPDAAAAPPEAEPDDEAGGAAPGRDWRWWAGSVAIIVVILAAAVPWVHGWPFDERVSAWMSGWYNAMFW